MVARKDTLPSPSPFLPENSKHCFKVKDIFLSELDFFNFLSVHNHGFNMSFIGLLIKMVFK